MNLVLTPTEIILMRCLWDSGEDLTVYEMVERLRELYGKTYTANAVSNFLTVLREKGVVSRYKKHHSHQYHPEITMDGFRKVQLENVRNQWYWGSESCMVSSLVELSDITEEELRKMKELLNGCSN